jgi:hypothetical protein
VSCLSNQVPVVILYMRDARVRNKTCNDSATLHLRVDCKPQYAAFKQQPVCCAA